MSVLSKALRFSAVFLLLNGCVANNSGLEPDVTQQDQPTNLSGDVSPNLDMAAQDTQEAKTVAQAPETALTPAVTAKGAPTVALKAIALNKTQSSAGSVTLTLSDGAPYELIQSAPTEYSLILPGVKIAEQAQYPQVAPAGTPGIRSVRATQRIDAATVRMFVDAGVTLSAKPQGSTIVVAPTQAMAALDSTARAQLKDEKAPAAKPVVNEDEARKNPTGITSADSTKVYTGRLISLDLQDTDIDNALRIIAEVSNLNIIASDEVAGKVTLRLVDVPWDQALDVILKTNGLDQVTEGNVIRIAPVDKLRQEREALLEARKAAQNLEELSVSYIRISYAKASDLVEQVEKVLTERGSVVVDERTNQLVIKDIKEGQQKSLELIKKLDLRTPQVLLETQIVEGSRSMLRDLGFQWGFNYNAGPETGNATGLNFPNSVAISGDATGGYMFNNPASIGDNGTAIAGILDSADGSKLLSFRLSALEDEGKVRIVSRPQVATINNKKAEIKSVEVLRVRTPDSGTSIATGSGASASGGASNAFEEIEVGITLDVTPQASPDYYVLLDVNAKSSTLGSTTVDDIPSTVERSATSSILVESGTTFALGGVYRLEDRDQVIGVPFLKDIPFLGYLFRRMLVNDGDQELIFFITPHIVEGSFDTGAMSAAK